MRPIYILLKFSLNYSFRLFYKRFKVHNNKHEMFSSTIFVSNHPNSFMDPILIGAMNRPVVHFMTRSDVFKWWLKPVLWASHMLPIYRQHDGADTKAKNSDTFRNANKALFSKRNILIFGEGFTDDTPILGLKPVKKGAVRMGFGALEACNWEQQIFLCALGMNYSDRNTIGSEFILYNGEKIRLNDFKSAYLENPVRTINDLTKRIEKEMQECIIYVEDPKNYAFVDHIQSITGKGFNQQNHDEQLDVFDLFTYAQNLASWVNETNLESDELQLLRKDLVSYFALTKRMKIEDRFVKAAAEGKTISSASAVLRIIALFPFALIGALHTFIPYLAAKKLTEKIFKRKVFWGSVKMMLGKLFGLIFTLPIVILVTKNYFPHWSLGIAYFLIIPLLWKAFYDWMKAVKEMNVINATSKADLSSFVAKRKSLVERIQQLIPVA